MIWQASTMKIVFLSVHVEWTCLAYRWTNHPERADIHRSSASRHLLIRSTRKHPFDSGSSRSKNEHHHLDSSLLNTVFLVRVNTPETEERSLVSHSSQEASFRWSLFYGASCRWKRQRSATHRAANQWRNTNNDRLSLSRTRAHCLYHTFSIAHARNGIPLEMHTMSQQTVLHFQWQGERTHSRSVDRVLWKAHQLVHRSTVGLVDASENIQTWKSFNTSLQIVNLNVCSSAWFLSVFPLRSNHGIISAKFCMKSS